MASYVGGMENVLREWAPLSDLFNRLPSKSQNGIFSQDVKLTCIDALPEFIVLGTNVGVVYWYDRKKKDLQRLRCESSNSPLTAVKVTSTVDYMVACGNKEGNISIFQVPKSHPDNLPDCLKPKNKQVERYTVSEMHNADISALEWSKNGMKLFSGDKNGLVVLTEIDFYMHLCKSVEVLNETYEVVQLSYYQQKLLISTTYRSIICQKTDKWKVTQVGKKDRKILGQFGGIFYQNGLRPSDVNVYCARPGLRIWESDVQGIVQKTLLFRDILSKESPEVALINPISNNLKSLKPCKEASFGNLALFSDDLLVTFSNDVVYVLNPKELTIQATVSNLRSVVDVATSKDEIFILEGERSLIRISSRPETSEETNSISPLSNTFMQIPNGLKELTNKLQTNSIISAIPPFIENTCNEFSVHTDATAVTNAEEATESQINLNDDDVKNKLEVFGRIGTEEFDDTILFKHSRRRRQNEMTSSITSCSSNSSDEKESTLTRPAIMNLSTVGFLPDLRSPDTILNDIRHKENILADVLNLEHVNINFTSSCNITKEAPEKLTENTVETQNVSTESCIFVKDVKEEKCVSNNYVNIPRNIPTPKKPIPKTNKDIVHCDRVSINQIAFDWEKAQNDVQISEASSTPACLNIPVEWKLAKVKVKEDMVDQSEVSFSDWEII